jgi:hypothetical protein
MGLLQIPIEVKEIMSRPSLRGVTEASNKIEITSSVTDSIIVYVQQNEGGDDVISFKKFRTARAKAQRPGISTLRPIPGGMGKCQGWGQEIIEPVAPPDWLDRKED